MERKIDIKIPAGIQSGEQLRQRGAGMSVLNGHGRGDLVARILVETPTKLSAKQKKILEEFRETETGDECPAREKLLRPNPRNVRLTAAQPGSCIANTCANSSAAA